MTCEKRPKRKRRVPVSTRDPPWPIVEVRQADTTPERRDAALDALAEFILKHVPLP